MGCWSQRRRGTGDNVTMHAAIRRIAIAIAVLAMALTGCDGRPVSTARRMLESVADGDFSGPVDIGNGRHLYLECRGKGSPTVVLESGYHNAADPWSRSDATPPATGPGVLPALAGRTRVCAYDRPGTLRYTDPPKITDRSSPVPMPRTAKDVVTDLHALLAAAHVPGPYILAGHSLGGLFARLYAQSYPDQVRAVVFVDAFAAEIPNLIGPLWPAYRQVLDTPLPEYLGSPLFEIVDIDKSVEQVAAAPAFPAVPTVVVTRTAPFVTPPNVTPDEAARLEQVWRDGAADLIALRPQTPHLVATGSDHFVQIHQPDLVAAAIELVMARAAGDR
jgi:pimeloyl-ACP methyl ester carboxylesterase